MSLPTLAAYPTEGLQPKEATGVLRLLKSVRGVYFGARFTDALQ